MKQTLVEQLKEHDPELSHIIDNLINVDVPQGELDERTDALSEQAILLGVKGVDVFALRAKDIIKGSLSAEEVKEVIYQATAYLGIGVTYPFLEAFNHLLEEEGIALPLECMGTTNDGNRREKGSDTQVTLFGERMRDFHTLSPINHCLAANCFGDYYTRRGLSLPERELITFCFLAGHGGCEPQLLSHAKANVACGNDKNMLKSLIYHNIPYLGYPRSLNALAIVEQA